MPNSASPFHFPLPMSAEMIPLIGQAFDPIAGKVLTRFGLEVSAADLQEETNQISNGKYFYVRDSNSFSDAFSFSMSTGGGGWGACSGMTAKASALLETNALTKTVHYNGMGVTGQSIVKPTAKLSSEAAKTLAQGVGPFIESYGTHFVAGYVYGRRCNLSYHMEFSSIDLATKFAASYNESASELGFDENLEASVRNALNVSKTSCSTSVSYAYRGFSSIAPTNLKGLQVVLQDFQPEHAPKDQPRSSITVVVFPWTYIDAVSRSSEGDFGLAANDALTDLADLVNKLVYVKNTCQHFIDSRGYDGQVQLEAVRAVRRKAEQEAEQILGYIDQCNTSGTPPTSDRAAQFAPSEELAERTNRALSSVPVFSPVSTPLRTGDIITLQADTGLYLSRMGNVDIRVAKGAPDQYSQFKVTILTSNQITLQADTGKYWSRWGDVGIRAEKDGIDLFGQFTVYSDVRFTDGTAIPFQDGTRIALQADTGKYLTRWGNDEVRAAKDEIDPYCLFKITLAKPH